MYARLTRFSVKPEAVDQAEQIGQRYEKVLHDLPGHVATTMCIEGAQLVSFSVWDTEEHATAVTPGARDAAQRDLAEILVEPPSTTIGRAIVHDVRR
jgi:heme-degrading monooxygenase HmoA